MKTMLELSSRMSIDEVKKPSGDMLLQFLKDCKLSMVNGRSGKGKLYLCVPETVKTLVYIIHQFGGYIYTVHLTHQWWV